MSAAGESSAQEKATERLEKDLCSGIGLALECGKKKPTLSDLLFAMQRGDEALAEMSDEQATELCLNLKDKVDSYKYVDDKFEAEINRIKADIQALSDAKKSLEGNQDRLRSLMAYHMKEKGYEKLPGKLWQVSLRTKKEVDYTLSEANATTYLIHGPDLMERSYSWKKSEVKRKVLSDPEKFKDFGTIKEKSHIAFTVRKEITP